MNTNISINKENSLTQNDFLTRRKNNTWSDVQTILNTDMTRDRDLLWVQKNLPTLENFIDYCIKNWSKKMIDLCSGKGLLADGIQNKYNTEKNKEDYIQIWRSDILWAKERQTDQKAIGWKHNRRIDIKNLPNNLPDIYSIFWLQYFYNAPDMIEGIRKKLAVWSRAYIQFPEGIRSNKAIQDFITANRSKNIVVYTDEANKDFSSIVFEFWKEWESDQPFDIPDFHIWNNFPLQWTNTWEKVTNSELFYRIWSKNNDPQREDLQKIQASKKDVN